MFGQGPSLIGLPSDGKPKNRLQLINEYIIIKKDTDFIELGDSIKTLDQCYANDIVLLIYVIIKSKDSKFT